MRLDKKVMKVFGMSPKKIGKVMKKSNKIRNFVLCRHPDLKILVMKNHHNVDVLTPFSLLAFDKISRAFRYSCILTK